jgi:hypothetical protein
MPLPSKAVEDKIRTIAAAWESLRPSGTFAGMTLEQFKAKVKPSLDARAAVEDCEHKLTAAQNARDDADHVSNDACLLIVNAVKGDPDEGENGELYEAMGYVRKSERKSGLKRGKLKAA